MEKDTFNLSNAHINGPAQFGSNNTQLIGEFSSFLDKEAIKNPQSEEIKKLLKQLQSNIVALPQFDNDEKISTTKEQITKELVKPEKEQDKNKMERYWRKIVMVLKDIGSVVGVVEALSKLLGLPVP